MPENSCGEPQWFYDRLKETNETGPYERAAINEDKQEIERLSHEVMRMQVHMQSLELDAIHEKHFREMHPAVKDAWEQYQSVLRLTQSK